MSLVHQSIISILSRRYVSCYYDTYGSDAHDDVAEEFVKNARLLHGDSVRYGGIFTPEGEMLISFGFDRLEFYLALRYSLVARPEYAWETEEEKTVFAAAKEAPEDVALEIAAAELATELLQFEKAAGYLRRAASGGSSRADENRALYLLGRLSLLDLGNLDSDHVRRSFDEIEDPDARLAEAMALDLMSLDLELRPKGVFFRGWQFKKERKLETVIQDLKRRIAAPADRYRIGEMHFYLGLAHMGLGDKKAANAVWRAHYTQWPEDRLAMLSRIHDTSYWASPYGSSRVTMSGSSFPPSNTPWLIEQLARKGIVTHESREQ